MYSYYNRGEPVWNARQLRRSGRTTPPTAPDAAPHGRVRQLIQTPNLTHAYGNYTRRRTSQRYGHINIFFSFPLVFFLIPSYIDVVCLLSILTNKNCRVIFFSFDFLELYYLKFQFTLLISCYIFFFIF